MIVALAGEIVEVHEFGDHVDNAGDWEEARSLVERASASEANGVADRAAAYMRLVALHAEAKDRIEHGPNVFGVVAALSAVLIKRTTIDGTTAHEIIDRAIEASG